MNTKTLCLAVLHFGEKSGYDIKKLCSEGFFKHFVEVSLASIYPTLSKLEDEGLVSARVEHQDGKPSRKIYALNPSGHKVLHDQLSEGPGPDKHISEFLLLMKCCHLLAPEKVSQLIDERLAYYTREIETLDACIEEYGSEEMPAGSQFVLGYGRTIYNAVYDYVSQNRALLEEAAGSGLSFSDAAE